MITHRILLVAAACASLGTLAHAQAPKYKPQSDTLVVTTRNPFRMFFVRGADTLGNRVFSRGVTRESWRAKGDSVLIDAMRRDLDFSRKDTSVRYLFAPDGRELSLDARAPRGLPSSLMPLPTVPLRAGLVWNDSSVIARDTNGFAMRYEWVMTYRVQRMFDSLGGRVADVVADGRYRMRAQFGDTAQKRQWIDVRGPDHETFLFDVSRGRQLHRTWDMKLRGWGGGRLPGDSVASPDSVPAGLDSKTFNRLLAKEEVGIVGYRQEGRDTSITVTIPDAGIAGVHVIDRSADSVVSSNIRADGNVTLERAVYARGKLQRYERAWTDTALRAHRERVTHERDSVIVVSTDGTRRAYETEVSFIGVGDVGREELLVPLLLRLPLDSGVTMIGVFRPSFHRLDYAELGRKKVRGGWLMELAWQHGQESDLWLVDDSGDLLFVEGRSDERTRRVPSQQPRVDAMTKLTQSIRDGG